MVRFKIGEVAAMFDVSIRAIRLYDTSYGEDLFNNIVKVKGE